jgi:hypothetical protein
MTICKFENGCKKNASFNYKGQTPKFCRPHKKENMINVKSPLCKECDKNASFNIEGKKAPEYCDKHKKDGMINVKKINKKCKFEGCEIKQACFNYETEKIGLYCDKHKLDGMVNVYTTKCLKCNTQALFNYETEKKALYCSKHKKDKMVNLVCPKCNFDNCIEYAYYNYKQNNIGLYCKEHKLSGMIDVKHGECDFDGCNTIPYYNYEEFKKGLYCFYHKKDNMIDVRNKKCIECKNSQLGRNKYNDHCLRCFIYKFPDNKISRNFKVKERHIQDFLEEEFPDEFIYDKTIDQGCSKRRPDAFKECGTHTIIIEVDEYQHRNYEEICENKRMMELFTDLANRPTIFIRFNPDSYIDKNNNKIESSFSMHKQTDVPIIKNPIEWQDRLIKLKQIIEHHIDTIPEKAVTIEKLFYDEKN